MTDLAPPAYIYMYAKFPHYPEDTLVSSSDLKHILIRTFSHSNTRHQMPEWPVNYLHTKNTNDTHTQK